MKHSRFGRLIPFLLVLIAGTVAAHSQTYSVLYNFGTQLGDPNMEGLSGQIAQGLNGSLYSAAPGGGTANDGAAYSLTTGGRLSVLHSFSGADGAQPVAGMVLGVDSNFYGTSVQGGTCANGTVYKVGSTGGFAALHQFSCTDGDTDTPPTQASDGNFYGVTNSGGTFGYGVIYRMAPNGQFSVIHQLDGSIYSVHAPLRLGTDGGLYGVSGSGGTLDHGTFFKITTAGQFTVLYNFDHTNGGAPAGGLYQGTDGNFYGIAFGGGTSESGVVFRVTPTGSYLVLHQINGTTDGAFPLTELIQGSDGNFYGATSQGGLISSACPYGCGTLYKITPQGAYTVLHTFTHTDGDSPWSGIYQHTNGKIYGTTRWGGAGPDPACQANCGVFFSLDAGLPPYAALTPYEGGRGSNVIILGQGFKNASSVAFNGVTASFNILSDTAISATVPGTTSGVVKVTLGRLGSLSSKVRFIVR